MNLLNPLNPHAAGVSNESSKSKKLPQQGAFLLSISYSSTALAESTLERRRPMMSPAMQKETQERP